MLPAQSRMRKSGDFTTAVRHGKRSGRAFLTAHLLLRPERVDEPPRAGFVVARTVGSAVVRNKVRRRLRSEVRGLLPSLPGGSLFVVRAHPQAATARQADLAAELSLVTGKLLRQFGAGR